MTLGGIAAAIGLLIDDVIVMIEHIARRAGAPGAEHASTTVLGAAREFLQPLFGSSLATMIIFVPLAFLSGLTGAFFKFLSITMASALVISCLLAAYAVPLLAARHHRFRQMAGSRYGARELAAAHPSPHARPAFRPAVCSSLPASPF